MAVNTCRCANTTLCVNDSHITVLPRLSTCLKLTVKWLTRRKKSLQRSFDCYCPQPAKCQVSVSEITSLEKF
jgi:hypothetical protein